MLTVNVMLMLGCGLSLLLGQVNRELGMGYSSGVSVEYDVYCGSGVVC